MPDQQQKEDLVLMTQKGVYPYKYMNSYERFQEPYSRPKDAIYCSLTEESLR